MEKHKLTYDIDVSVNIYAHLFRITMDWVQQFRINISVRHAEERTEREKPLDLHCPGLVSCMDIIQGLSNADWPGYSVQTSINFNLKWSTKPTETIKKTESAPHSKHIFSIAKTNRLMRSLLQELFETHTHTKSVWGKFMFWVFEPHNKRKITVEWNKIYAS